LVDLILRPRAFEHRAAFGVIESHFVTRFLRTADIIVRDC
jgi:hypothetical protein